MPADGARRRIGIAAVALAALACLPRLAGAHALSPALLVLREARAGVFDVTWKIPVFRIIGADLEPRMPADCPVVSASTPTDDGEGLTSHFRIDCGARGLVGKTVGVDGLGTAKTDALLRIELADGRAIDTVLRSSEPTLVIPEREERLTLASRYVALGVEHILTGYDHLLFVFGLLLLAADVRALVATVSAFTLGHSVTLTLAALDLARVPPAPVEVLIAFSIFVLAVELARNDGANDATFSRRRPWLMALAFGFLHGLGFAGTLRATGLPAGAVPLALFGFNVGIELGQLAFVLTVLALTAAARPLLRRAPAWSYALPSYVIGSLAACWMIERARALFA
jgi:hydrogenase/urease accessory protein HupE